MVTVRCATVSVPLREAVVELAAIEKFTCPLPVPLLPDVIVIQPVLLAADQPQPVEAVTATELVLLPAAKVTFDGETL